MLNRIICRFLLFSILSLLSNQLLSQREALGQDDPDLLAQSPSCYSTQEQFKIEPYNDGEPYKGVENFVGSISQPNPDELWLKALNARRRKGPPLSQKEHDETVLKLDQIQFYLDSRRSALFHLSKRHCALIDSHSAVGFILKSKHPYRNLKHFGPYNQLFQNKHFISSQSSFFKAKNGLVLRFIPIDSVKTHIEVINPTNAPLELRLFDFFLGYKGSNMKVTLEPPRPGDNINSGPYKLERKIHEIVLE